MNLLNTQSHAIDSVTAYEDGWVVQYSALMLHVPRDMCDVPPRAGETLRTAQRGVNFGTVFALVIGNRCYRWDDYPEERP